MERRKKQKINKIKFLDVVENENNIFPTNTEQKYNDVDDGGVDKVIDRVNGYCLEQIFMHISVFERPKIAQVCKKWNEALKSSWYDVKKIECLYWKHDSDETERENKKSRCLKGLITQCGRYLTELNIISYDKSDIMPLIRRSCPQLVNLRLRFAYVKNVHFRNAFSHMSNLQSLKIIFQCHSSIPTMLINSLEDVADTLNLLAFFNWKRNKRNKKLPDLFTLVLPRLNALQYFDLFGYQREVNRPLLNSIPASVDFFYQDDVLGLEYDRDLIEPTYMHVFYNDGVTNDVLINIANTFDILETLKVWCFEVTDIGIIALTHKSSLKQLRIRLDDEYNDNITDLSVQLFKNMTYLDVRMCNVTNYSIIKVIENSPELMLLRVAFTKVTHEIVKKAAELTRNRTNGIILSMMVSFVNVDGIFDTPEYQSPFLKIEYVDSTEDLVGSDDYT